MFNTSFVSFAYNHPSVKRDMRNSFDELEDFEDLLDSAYLRDCDPEEITISCTRDGKVPSLAQAERAAYNVVKWVIDNMRDNAMLKMQLIPIAKEWAVKIAPEIVKQAPNYID